MIDLLEVAREQDLIRGAQVKIGAGVLMESGIGTTRCDYPRMDLSCVMYDSILPSKNRWNR